MCEQRARVPVGTVAAVLGGAVALSWAVSWLTGAWPLALAVTVSVVAMAAAAGWAVSGVSRRAGRVAVMTWPVCGECGRGPWLHRVAGRERVCLFPPEPAAAAPRVRAALPAPPLAIEAPRAVQGVIISSKEAVR